VTVLREIGFVRFEIRRELLDEKYILRLQITIFIGLKLNYRTNIHLIINQFLEVINFSFENIGITRISNYENCLKILLENN